MLNENSKPVITYKVLIMKDFSFFFIEITFWMFQFQIDK